LKKKTLVKFGVYAYVILLFAGTSYALFQRPPIVFRGEVITEDYWDKFGPPAEYQPYPPLLPDYPGYLLVPGHPDAPHQPEEPYEPEYPYEGEEPEEPETVIEIGNIRVVRE